MDWSSAEAPSLDDVETLARAAFESLPEEFRGLAGDIRYLVQDFPDDEVVRDMELESPFDILGLFQGPDLASHEAAQVHAAQTMIFLYRRPILDYWAENQERLGDIVRHVLVHEIGHHFGLSDADMDAIEARAD
ncbi:MAG: metallopeptidase family protein [Alphaproteobacteria bacterium]|nr:metallopeptidase family protein [Alphaproteobacteria bacterium]MBV9694694.1 metallopeptidase family protein [Alphaproteobacteria bacterium]